MYNSCNFIGNLGKDPETKAGANGKPFTVFSVGVNKPGDKDAKTLWLDVIAFGPQGEFAGKYLHKGSQVLVQGAIETKEYKAKDGQLRTSLSLLAREVVSLSKKEGQAASAGAGESASTGTPTPVTDEDIPF